MSMPPHFTQAAIAQLGERQTEDLKVPGSITGLGIIFVSACSLNSAWKMFFFSLEACAISSFRASLGNTVKFLYKNFLYKNGRGSLAKTKIKNRERLNGKN